MSTQINQIYEFGDFRLETAERLLLHEGKPISLSPKVFETLVVMVKNSGHVIEKNDLINQIWGETVVEEVNLARNIWTLRKALGEHRGTQRYIETVPKVGYRFVAEVTELGREESSVLLHRRVRARIVRDDVEIPEANRLFPATQYRPRRRIAFGILAVIGFLTTITVIWLWPHTKTSATSETRFRFLTDGLQNDNAAYWNNRGEIFFSRYLSDTRYETWKMNADGTNPHRANTEIHNLLVGRWSPDGKKVVFRKDDDNENAFLADGDGTNEIVLPSKMGNMDWSPDGSQIVYEVRTSNEHSQIFLYTIKTARSIALTDNQSLNADPSFSPDGKQIAFVSDRDKNANIYLMDTDGSNLRQLTNDLAFDNYPVFSPDGTQIAFQSNREEEHVEVYLKNVNDRTPPRRLTHTRNGMGIAPKCWSADGTQILMYMNQNGKDRIVLGDVEPAIAPVLSDEAADLSFPRLSADGKQTLYEARNSDDSLELRLTNWETKRTQTIFKTGPNYPSSFHLAPAWSPDNNLIALTNIENGNSEIFTIKADGSGLKNLTNNPLPDTNAAFSPTGDEIIFVRDNYNRAQLYRMNLNGGNQRRVTNKNGYEITPAFSPDGNYLAFAGDREGHGLDIFLLPLNNLNDERLLAARRFHDVSPIFSPDGSRIAFIANSDGNPEIYIMNADGTGLVRLTHTKTEETSPQFSKDGKSILFAANSNGRFAIYEIVLP